jgi:cytochrome c-type biogenesis protein
MLDEFFTFLTLALSGNMALALSAAFAWGVASILLSPCHLSSIPLVIGYLSADQSRSGWMTFLLALVFAFGILVTIALMGVATAAMGRLLGDVGFWGNLFVASLFFVMGLALLDVLRFPWVFPAGDSMRGRGLTGALVLGLLFGVGLGPCTFAFLAPVLGVVFGTAFTSPHLGIVLLIAFALGHCSVIVLAGILAHVVARYLAWTSASPGATWMRKAAGVLVILAGVYNITLAF